MKHKLLPLSYAMDALQPYLTKEALEFLYDKLSSVIVSSYKGDGAAKV
ncbi:MAG: hypothetical protein ACOH1I_05815 [Gallionellaceae bacterium]|jgi:superoxide dismutase